MLQQNLTRINQLELYIKATYFQHFLLITEGYYKLALLILKKYFKLIQCHRINEFFKDDSHESGQRKLAYFIKLRLGNFKKLEVEVNSIISMAYLRALQTTSSGIEIQYLLPWFRSTSYNIIREYDRKRRNDESYNAEFNEKTTFSQSFEEDQKNSSQNKVPEEIENIYKKVLINLTKKERKILILKYIKNWTWKEVYNEIEYNTSEKSNEENKRKVDALRTKAKRLKKKLKHLIEEDSLSSNLVKSYLKGEQ